MTDTKNETDTAKAIEEMSLKELNEKHAELAGEGGGKFKKKADAIEGIRLVLAAQEGLKGKRKRKLFNWPCAEKSEGIKPHRAGKKRARVIEMLASPEGATFEEISAEIGWNERTTYEGVKLIHSHLGYGLREQVEGERGYVIRLVVPEGHVIQTIPVKGGKGGEEGEGSDEGESSKGAEASSKGSSGKGGKRPRKGEAAA